MYLKNYYVFCKESCKKMTLREEDKVLINFLRQNKNNKIIMFLKKYPDKGWTLGGLNAR